MFSAPLLRRFRAEPTQSHPKKLASKRRALDRMMVTTRKVREAPPKTGGAVSGKTGDS